MRQILSYFLVRDRAKCENSGHCSRLLPDFIRVYRGELIVSESNYRQEEVRHAIDSVIGACPNKAISIKKRTQ